VILSCGSAFSALTGDRVWGVVIAGCRAGVLMNLVEELLAPDDVTAYLGVLLDKGADRERYPRLSMIRRLLALTS
jgi:hypothetical protein